MDKVKGAKKPVFRRVLCAYDGSDVAEKALLKASQIAKNNNAKFYVVYVIDERDLKWDLRMDVSIIWNRNIDEIEEGIREAATRKAESIITKAKKKVRGVKAQFIIEKGDIAEKIVELEKTLGCDLTVVGSHGRGGIKQFILGSISDRVVKMSSKPVLIVR
jgi:nucleotide-binding universal stress UspA family protein